MAPTPTQLFSTEALKRFDPEQAGELFSSLFGAQLGRPTIGTSPERLAETRAIVGSTRARGERRDLETELLRGQVGQQRAVGRGAAPPARGGFGAGGAGATTMQALQSAFLGRQRQDEDRRFQIVQRRAELRSQREAFQRAELQNLLLEEELGAFAGREEREARTVESGLKTAKAERQRKAQTTELIRNLLGGLFGGS